MKASVETTRDEVGECLEAVKCDLNTKVSQAKADTYSHSLTIASLERGQQHPSPVVAARRRERADAVHLPFVTVADMTTALHANAAAGHKPAGPRDRERPHRILGDAVQDLRTAVRARARITPSEVGTARVASSPRWLEL